MASGVICAHCGAANRDDARFCGVCGKAIASTEPAAHPAIGEPPVMIGREIAGRYRILAKLGEGGMGAVFRAEQISLRRTVAVKLLRPEIVGNPMLLRRFNAEAEAVAKLSHPNTVGIYDFGQDTDGTLFIAMELIEGRSLRQAIHAEAPLLPRRALAIARQVAASLADAHARSIVHRDLKPDNVMLQDRGRERDIVRVLDFGIAKLRDDSRQTQQAMTQQGDMLGTPQYMAPEQIRGEAVDGRTDVYALGCLLYVMVTGRLPHEAPTILALLSKHLLEHPVPPSQRRPELGLSPAIDRLILGAMAKDPAARPPTMETMGEQIAALLAEQPPVAGPTGPTMPPAVSPSSLPPALLPPAVAVPIGVPRSDTPVAYSSAAAPPRYGVAPAPPVAARRGPPRRSWWPACSSRAPRSPRSRSSRSDPTSRPTSPTSHSTSPTTASPRDDKTDPPPAPPGPDPWARTTPITGDTVSVGEGVELIVPSGFRTTTANGYLTAFDPRGVMIIAGPIAILTDDPQQLAQYHARANNLVFESMQQIFVGGVQRPMAVFHGVSAGTPVRHVAVALISKGYRIVVMFQAPTQLASADPAIQALLFEALHAAHRVALTG